MKGSGSSIPSSHGREPMKSNMGLWESWYVGLTDPQPYGDDTTYQRGADWLSDCELVEDWGCGKGWMRKFVSTGYRGIDGTASMFADIVADLVAYRSTVPGVFMRHVLEHDYRWREILENAVASFTERMVLVVFTPMAAITHEITFHLTPGVPDMGFAESDLTSCFGDAAWTSETLQTQTQYGVETIFYIRRA